MYYPSFEEFREKTKEGNLIPVYKEILADLETPVSAFLKIDKPSRPGGTKYSFLLESVEGGETIGRFSFLGSNPSVIIRSKGRKIEIIRNGVTETKEFIDPLFGLKEILKVYKPVKIKGLPRFHGGLVGYLGYEFIHFFENIPRPKKDSLELPESLFLLTDTILVFDHVSHTIKVVSNAFVTPDKPLEECYKEATAKIDEKILQLNANLSSKMSKKKEIVSHKSGEVSSNIEKRRFLDMVDKAKEYIKAGDIFQVVLSQRFQTKIEQSPFDIYRSLRVVNPSPYMFYLKMDKFHLIGSSPEVFVRKEDNKIELRPIAGTRPRGNSAEEDEKLVIDLKNDPKELAEHTMLLDLGRNDLGRVAKFETIKVPEMMVIEKYSHVMHIVSDVAGEIMPDKDQFDLIRATFPAGTVSGAPKVRAMEIIAELEKEERGPYAGMVGYFSFSGNLDSCITIRTILVKGKTAYIQAGAGIVADSDPEKEYHESINKAMGMIKAIEMAEGE
ncbi:MAG: anthranilate synthase component I [bacterium]|nr:anthranilate synthase component I [bacterium]